MNGDSSNTFSSNYRYHCRGWQMKGYLGINILFVFFQILLDDPCLMCFLMINLKDL